MNIFSVFQFFKTNYFNILLALLPVSFIAGNMIININIIVLILSSLIIYNKEIFKVNFYILDKVLILFFLLVIVTGIFNDFKLYKFHNEFYSNRELASTIKSILFLKYLLLYLIIRFLIENKNIQLNLFFIVCLFSSIFVCIDILIQFIFGKDLFGFEIEYPGRRLGGPLKMN